MDLLHGDITDRWVEYGVWSVWSSLPTFKTILLGDDFKDVLELLHQNAGGTNIGGAFGPHDCGRRTRVII